MNLECTWCEQTFSISEAKAQKQIRKRGNVRSRCPKCKTMNIIAYDSAGGSSSTSDKQKQIGASPRNRWIDSIQVQMTIILLLSITCILGSFLLYNYITAKTKITRELATFAGNTAERLSKYLVVPLWGVETEQIADALTSEMLEKQIYAIQITDQDHKGVLVGKKRGAGWEIEVSKNKIEGDYIEAHKEIRYRDDVIGKVHLYVTPKFMKEALGRSTMDLLVTTLILYVTIVIAVFVTLRKVVIHPIVDLTEAANRMSHGDLDTRIIARAKNEIGTLVEAINRMQTSLVLSFNRLKRKS